MKRIEAQDKASGFTLLEVLTATAMFAVIVGALYSLFYGSLRLRDNAFETLEEDLNRDYVAEMIRKDLASAVAASGVLSGSMVGTKENNGEARSDTLELHTASANLTAAEPWGEIQKVLYELQEPEETGPRATAVKRYDLVRTVTRNLLPATTEEPQPERILHDVESLEFAYYDGESWLEEWDSTTQETGLPEAIRATIRFAAVADEEQEDARPVLPLELVALVVAKPLAGATSGTTTTSTPSGGGQQQGAR